MEKQAKTINAVAAAITRKRADGETEIFVAERGYGAWKGYFEFPGGKIEAGETPEEALKREIREEFDSEIETDEVVWKIEYDYPEFHLSMPLFICSLRSGDLTLKEHLSAKWVTLAELSEVRFAPADESVLSRLSAVLTKKPETDNK